MRKVKVTATCTDYFEAIVEVPDHITDDEVMEFYRFNGANGEFTSVAYDWVWGYAEEADEDEGVDTKLEAEDFE